MQQSFSQPSKKAAAQPFVKDPAPSPESLRTSLVWRVLSLWRGLERIAVGDKGNGAILDKGGSEAGC